MYHYCLLFIVFCVCHWRYLLTFIHFNQSLIPNRSQCPVLAVPLSQLLAQVGGGSFPSQAACLDLADGSNQSSG
jgi:hypothetical protein